MRLHHHHLWTARRMLLAALLLTATAAVEAQENTAPTPSSPFREMMSLAGWTSEQYTQFADDRPLDAAANDELAKLFLRLRSIPVPKLSEWAKREMDSVRLLADPLPFRGELFHLSGEVIRVIEQRSAENATPRYLCEVSLDQGETTVEVLVPSIPAAWLKLEPLAQPVVCEAVFLRRTAPPEESGRLQFIAPRIAWYPTRVHPPEVNFGMTILSSLGVNLTDWESIGTSGSLREEDYEAFYQTLAAMRKREAKELVQLARDNLSSYVAPFRLELAKFDERSAGEQRRLALTEIITAADEGRYSVLPLFLEPATQRGALVVLDGVVRRAVRIDTSINRDGAPSDVVQRFGVDHYYELELFTADSQNLPLVFCVLELPSDFPTGDDLHEPVRLAGFFFKTWLYRGGGPMAGPTSDASPPAHTARRGAPLLIGQGPLRIVHSSAATPIADSGLVGGLFALAIAGVWLAAWWFARGDREFERTTLAKYQAPNEPLRIEAPESPAE